MVKLQKRNLSTTQIYAETSIQALGDNYLRALGGNNRTWQPDDISVQ